MQNAIRRRRYTAFVLFFLALSHWIEPTNFLVSKNEKR